jgi:hypothetical protein
MGESRPIDDIFTELEDHINTKGIVIGMVTIITKDNASGENPLITILVQNIGRALTSLKRQS